MPQANLPAPYDKLSWNELVARLAQELTQEKFKAEGDASQLQDLFKNSPNSLITARADYTAAAAANNGVSAYLQVLLRSGKTPQGPTPDLDEARQFFRTFEDDAARLRLSAPQIEAFAAQPGDIFPSIGDIAQVFDVILKAIEWFKNRHDQQRDQIADLLERNLWREWAQASDPAEPPPVPPGPAVKVSKSKA